MFAVILRKGYQKCGIPSRTQFALIRDKYQGDNDEWELVSAAEVSISYFTHYVILTDGLRVMRVVAKIATGVTTRRPSHHPL
jgi:hypothetical protein